MNLEEARKAVADAEATLMRMTENSAKQLMSINQPDGSILSILEGLLVLFAPSKRTLDWSYVRKYLNGNFNRFLTILKAFNKDRITEEQLNRLQSILGREECASERIRKCSLACYEISLWLSAIVQYSILRQKRKQTA